MTDQQTELFVSRVKAVAGSQYDYSQVVYTGALNRVKVICPKHGEKNPVASELLRGRVCRECGIEGRKKPLAAFISEIRKAHGDKYNYDHITSIKNNREKFTLVCPVSTHGSFQTNMLKHQQGQGCPKCGVAKRAAGRVSDAATALARLEETKIGDYDFSKFVYTGTQKKGIVYCRTHKHKFEMTYANLTCGHGCPKCGHERNLAGATARGVAGQKSLAGAIWTITNNNVVERAGSSWEILVFRWLSARYSEVRTQTPVKSVLGTYIADFYIPEIDMYIEVKGREISVGQVAKRLLVNNIVELHSKDIKAVFGQEWFTPQTWGKGLNQEGRNRRLNTENIKALISVDAYIKAYRKNKLTHP